MVVHLNFLFLIAFSIFNKCISEKLLFSFQINRHGARAPRYGLKDGVDIYKEKWSLEKNELTNIGKRQLYLLGVKVRKRYREKYNFLSDQYNPQEIYIRSTDRNRTIESIYSYLQGLYPKYTGPNISEKVYNNKSIIFPPNKKYHSEFDKIIHEFNMTKNEALPFQISVEPIHIFYTPKHEFGLYDSDICKTLYPHYDELNKRKEIKEYADNIIDETHGLWLDLEPEVKDASYFYDYWNLYNYVENFICDDTDVRNFTVIREKYPYVNDSLLEKLNNKSRQFIEEDVILVNSWVNLSIVGASYTMHSILNWMENAINNHKQGINNNYIKFVIYSAHDSSIANIEGFMKYAFNTNIEFADFSDCRFFELYLNDTGKYNVRYLKGDDTVKLDIDFDEFKSIINDRTWSDKKVDEFCQFDENKKENNTDNNDENKDGESKNTLRILLIVFGATDGVLILVLISILIFMKKKT